MKVYAVLAENKLGDWTVLKICESEGEAKEAVKAAWATTDAYGFGIYHSVQVFERWMA